MLSIFRHLGFLPSWIMITITIMIVIWILMTIWIRIFKLTGLMCPTFEGVDT